MLTILELIGNTPIVEGKRLAAGPCRLFLKLENQNPGGSIKDRIALSMIAAAESEGRIKPGDLLVEATAGNTGLGLALVAAQKGYRLLIVVPDKMSKEKIFHLKAMGAEVLLTRSDVTKGHPEYYQDLAARRARETGAYYINQFGNPANPRAHEQTTGPEIWEQMEHAVAAVVAGAGTAGTITGLARSSHRAEARRDPGLRQRQQVPLQGVQRLLDARPGLHRARALRRPARPDRAPPPRARGRHRERRRDGSQRLPAHEALRRFAAAGAQGRQDRRHRRRGGHPARGLR